MSSSVFSPSFQPDYARDQEYFYSDILLRRIRYAHKARALVTKKNQRKTLKSMIKKVS